MLETAKESACRLAVEGVRNGMVLGLGTGSTVKYAILEIGRMCREGMDLVGVPTSKATEGLAVREGIPLATVDSVEGIDITIDGADEVSPDFQLTKGMGGALTREKIIAQASKKMYVVVDETKLVKRLGSRSPLPVEVVNGYERYLLRRLEAATGGKGVIRTVSGQTYVTDNGNPIIDLRFESINDPRALATILQGIAGVVEHGLFLDTATKVFVGNKDGSSYEVKR